MKKIKFRVLFVTSKSFGGSGKYITVLAAALRERGIHCDLVYFPSGVDQDVEIESAFVNAFHFFHKPNLSPITCWLNALQVRAILKKHSYDAVHTHTSLGGLMGRIGAKLSRNRALFVGHTIHAYGADEFTPVPQKWFYWAIERTLDFFTDGYVSPSRYMVEYGARTKVITPGKATVIYNSLPLTKDFNSASGDRVLKRAELGIGDDVCMLLFCGRLERQKGVDVLLSALAKLRLLNRVHLVICGVGEDEATLRAQATANNLNSQITWVGWQSDVTPFYSASDIYVMPSRWESFGLVFLEAMNYSKPVISTAVQAIPEVVDSGVTGLLSHPGDVDALARNIDTLVADPNLRLLLGQAGKERLDDKFRFENFVDEHVKWYGAEILRKSKVRCE